MHTVPCGRTKSMIQHYWSVIDPDSSGLRLYTGMMGQITILHLVDWHSTLTAISMRGRKPMEKKYVVKEN